MNNYRNQHGVPMSAVANFNPGDVVTATFALSSGPSRDITGPLRAGDGKGLMLCGVVVRYSDGTPGERLTLIVRFGPAAPAPIPPVRISLDRGRLAARVDDGDSVPWRIMYCKPDESGLWGCDDEGEWDADGAVADWTPLAPERVVNAAEVSNAARRAYQVFMDHARRNPMCDNHHIFTDVVLKVLDHLDVKTEDNEEEE